MPNQRAVQHWREALQIVIKPRLVGREPYGVRSETPLRLKPPAANWSLIACYESFFPATRSTRDK